MKNKEKNRPSKLLSLLLIIPLFINLASCRRDTGDNLVLELNKANPPQGLSTSNFENVEQTIETKEIAYENVRGLKNYHVELDKSGLFYNKLSSPLYSITSIKVVFETEGTLSLATSADGVDYSSTFITSGTVNATATNPDYFKLIANESSVKIESVIIVFLGKSNNSNSSSDSSSIDDTSSTEDSSEIGSSSEPDSSSEPGSSSEPPLVVTLISLDIEESKTDYDFGDVYLNTNSLVVTGTFSDNSIEELSYEATSTTGYGLILLDPNGNVFYPNNPFIISGAYQVSATYLDVVSNIVTINVANGQATTNATINVLTNPIAETTIVDDVAAYLTAENIEIEDVAASNIFGGGNAARFRFTSSKASGSLTITFKNSILINAVTLGVSQYNDRSTSVKVATSGNEEGQTLTLSSGISSLTYTAFINDKVASNSITISSPARNQFYLYSINLTVGESEPVAVTGLTLSPSTLAVSVGSSETITANVLPSDATNKKVDWDALDSSIATVSEAGLVTGVKEGETTIRATTVDGGFSATITISVVEAANNNFHRATNVDPNFNLQDIKKHYDLNAIPATGEDINVLVIPIEISDYPFTPQRLNDIERVFNGSVEETGYWHSVSSFYQESSFGKLDLNFTVDDKYVTGKTAKQLAGLTSGVQYFTQNVLRNAVSDYKVKNGTSSTQKFDSDTDGFIDAVWMVYSAPNYSVSTVIENISTDYWAYVFWDYDQADSGNPTSPVQNVYGWASYDFMYEGTGENSGNIDAHTFIHETGHLLGLDDYYNYDYPKNKYAPMGGIAMMDFNITDHDAWSKMVLGWQNPYIVTGDAEITIDPSQINGDSILIADSWNGTSYDEFILLELYTPTGLNKLDSDTAYGGSTRGYTTSGIRMLHVDSRLARHNNSNGNFVNYVEPTSLNISGNYYYDFAHSNTPSASADANYRLLHMIQATNVNTFKNDGTGTNADLFKTGQTFSMATYGSNFFKNGTKLNNNNALGYTIDFVSVSATSATIRINKI